MKNEQWLFIGTDRRLKICHELFKEQGFATSYVPTDTFTDELVVVLEQLQPTHMVFPILQLEGEVPPALLRKDVQLYTGVASEAWIAPLKEEQLAIQSYLQEEQFVWENARLTAEAFIHLFYTNEKRSITGKEIIIAGFGRVGKMLALMLNNIGAKVIIAVRSAVQRAEAAALQYQTIDLVACQQLQTGILVNTIPKQWLTVNPSSTLRIFDVASAPGCLTTPDSSEYYTIHLGLPGKHFPVDAAIALKEALLRMYRKREGT